MVEIYTDGSCLKNPYGPSGSGVVMIYGKYVKTISYSIGSSTNNRAELTAILKALQNIKEAKRHMPITIYTDSRYCIGVCTKTMKANKNLDLVTTITELLSNFSQVSFKWVKGHNGNRWNEIADRLALSASRLTEGSNVVNLLDSHDHPVLNQYLVN